ncbi:MAG: T9SS C-terminal target domain-containing protein, partial [Flavicella sp.]|nr:T9SS C-terminal target domain-containing protein [Flavicella sp.]
MKNKLKLTLLVSLCMSVGSIYGQESSNTSGGNAAGSGGTVAYSIGQVAYTYESGTNGNSNQGVQQPYEIYSVGI